jgi:hypothetical protein
VTSDSDVPLAGPPSLDDLAKLKLAVWMIGSDALLGNVTVGVTRNSFVVALANGNSRGIG